MGVPPRDGKTEIALIYDVTLLFCFIRYRYSFDSSFSIQRRSTWDQLLRLYVLIPGHNNLKPHYVQGSSWSCLDCGVLQKNFYVYCKYNYFFILHISNCYGGSCMVINNYLEISRIFSFPTFFMRYACPSYRWDLGVKVWGLSQPFFFFGARTVVAHLKWSDCYQFNWW